ncbi:MAG: D-aminoacylase, partial [bacterium]|nr:D-aminoacylase [bacterium]
MRTLALVFALCLSVFAQNSITHIRNVTIVDGTGKPGFIGDVTIKGSTISKIGKPNSAKPKTGETVIEGAGLVLAPGFIDIHNHSESGLLREGVAANQVSQGITTVIVGPDGGSPESIGDYFSKLDGKIGINVGAFIGHGTI